MTIRMPASLRAKVERLGLAETGKEQQGGQWIRDRIEKAKER
jgi:hypothetical protein